MKARTILAILIIGIFILCTLNAGFVSITEVELNPAGSDSGNEWVELYSKKEISLDKWKLVNQDDGEIILNFSFSDYYVFEFESQWLDNKDEKVCLIDAEGDEVDCTEVFADSVNNDKTWQLCDGDWFLIEESDGKKNDCESISEREENEDREDETVNEDDENEINKKPNYENNDQEIIKTNSINKIPNLIHNSDIIKLNKNSNPVSSQNKENRMIYKSKSEYIKEGAIYGFTLLCVFFIVLLIKDK